MSGPYTKERDAAEAERDLAIDCLDGNTEIPNPVSELHRKLVEHLKHYDEMVGERDRLREELSQAQKALNVASWAAERLRILADTCDPAEKHVHADNLPAWVADGIRRIGTGLAAALSPAPKPEKPKEAGRV